MLLVESAIDPAVIAERGYRAVSWTLNDQDGRRELARLKVPTWARPEKGIGLLIPVYRATGEHIGVQWRPDTPQRDRQGKRPKYVMPAGTAGKLDVHPRNKDRIADPTVELWVTEGVKKADALTSRGACTVALAGVYNWRSRNGTLGDWEDIPLKGRDVVICFDADAVDKPNVLRAMQRFGAWLVSKRAKPVYLVTPDEVNGNSTKGADDFLAAGGTLDELRRAARSRPPTTTNTDATFTDAQMAETISDEVLDGKYLWCKGLGWLGWDGRRWDPESSDEQVTEACRQFVLAQFSEALAAMRIDGGQPDNASAIDGWRSMLGAGRIRAALALARGIVERRADEFDSDADLLNTPSGIADLATGELLPHEPALLMTKITKGSYRPGFTCPDWTSAQEALPPVERDWLQARLGQAATGRPTPDGVVAILQGGGENGKSVLTTDGAVVALGDYGSMASAKLILSSKGTEHSTEMADLRGRRLLIAEEMTEGRALDVTTIKRIQDVGKIKARFVHKDNMEFTASHSLFVTTNYMPVVNEVDHGTWRRLGLLRFPYTFRKPNESLERPEHRRGDPGLKERVKAGAGGAHDAIVTWVVDGAVRVHKEGAAALALTPAITKATHGWRCGADRVLGYWTERLIADPKACVSVTDLLNDFNSWLRESGHQEWSKETFTPRFGEHSETRRHGVERRETCQLAGWVPRPLWGHTQTRPARAKVWLGVRWRTEADAPEEEAE
jgi:P4 family phage/plasmid primase-like protien